MNQVLRLIASTNGASPRTLLLFLNDSIQDGRDISWIWDTDYELLSAQQEPNVVISGSRAEELALRWKYAGFRGEPAVIHDTGIALKEALARTPSGETLYVVPTYTAMLEVRELLASRGGRERFWQDA
jgi:UDP-N-acetylmuramyl tripeptide synthase